MKKALALFLALALCLSLAACGLIPGLGEDPYEKYAKYEELFLYLENNDRAGAEAYIQDYFGPVPVAPETMPTEPIALETSINTEPSETEPAVVYIHDAAELFSIDGSAEKTYILANDIDLAGFAGTIEDFYGLLDGNGKTIRNATAPLIGTNFGTVQNLSVLDCSIQLTDEAAAIALSNWGTVRGCTVSGMIHSIAENAFAGGVVCTNEDGGTVEDCVNTADITADSYALNDLGNEIHGTWAQAGGICANNYGNIYRCVNHGDIASSGADYITASGGIISGNSDGEIMNCYNTGTITAVPYQAFHDCGGIAGFSDAGKFVCCYNIGVASSGLIGDNRDYIIDCYYLSSVSENGSGSGKNTAGERYFAFSPEELTKEETFSAFDFETVWIMTENGPELR